MKRIVREFWFPVAVAATVIALAFAFAGKSRADDGVQWQIVCINGVCQWVRVGSQVADLPKAATTPPSKSSVKVTQSVQVSQAVQPIAKRRVLVPLLRASVVRTRVVAATIAHRVAYPFGGRFRRCP